MNEQLAAMRAPVSLTSSATRKAMVQRRSSQGASSPSPAPLTASAVAAAADCRTRHSYALRLEETKATGCTYTRAHAGDQVSEHSVEVLLHRTPHVGRQRLQNALRRLRHARRRVVRAPEETR